MKTIAYTALHNGRDYLGYAIKSVIDYVDEYYVLYAAQGSHGHRTSVPCPDTREDLYTIAQAVAGDKLHWIDGDWRWEGQQRDSIMEHCPDADVIIVLDADEIWGDGLVPEIVRYAKDGHIRHWRCRMVHYWRSFHRAIIHDPAYPERVIVPKYPSGDRTFTGGRVASHLPPIKVPENCYWISHMGYAQRPEIVQYKQAVHGHRNEWRSDVNWFQDKYMANAQHDCHPVGSDYWNPEPVNPLDYMPAFMAQHPYFDMEVIE